MLRLFYYILFLTLGLELQAQDFVIKGTIRVDSNTVASFATVGATSLASGELKGVTSNEAGQYSLRLKPGKYTLVIHLIGYNDLQIDIAGRSGEVLQKDFVLTENPDELSSVQIFADRKGIANGVMKNAIDARPIHQGKGEALRYNSYIKNSVVCVRPDTAKTGRDSTYLALKEKKRPKISLQKYLIESSSAIHFAPPLAFHQEILAYNNFVPYRERTEYNANIKMELGEPDIEPQQFTYEDNYLLNSKIGYNEYTLYNRLLDIPSIAEKKILSPIGSGAMLSYSFDLDRIYLIDTTRIYVIKIKPIFKSEPLFSGTVHIRSDNWALIHADLFLSQEALYVFKDFHIEQDYSPGPSGQFVLSSNKINYSTDDKLVNYFANIDILNSDFEIAEENYKFSDEEVVYKEDSFDKDSLYWENLRPASFNELETGYAHHCDSLQNRYASDEFYEEIDSSYNNIKFWDFIVDGLGFRNRKKGREIFINPLLMQMNPVGIGGYRHRFGGAFVKDFDNGTKMETEGFIDYGFKNRDVKGKIGVGFTYLPKKFVRTFIRAGDYYDMINTYASIGSLFSRSNYVRARMFSISQRMEIVNGLFCEASFEFSDQNPINNLSGDKWSQRVFGDVNTPITFERYTKSEFRIDLKYKIKQKYQIKKNKKILLGSRYPELFITYRKGIPGLFQSEVNFDYIELKIKNETELGRFGNMEWSLMCGSFVNKSNLRLLEHKYFRGSDKIFFSDPTSSFQLLGPTLSTPNAFLRGNYFHHFNGLLLNKIPLIRKLKLTESVGAAFLSIPSQNFHHAEFYAGLERVFRIRQEIFKVGIYGCTAHSSFNKARIELKIGLNFFDSFHKKWQY
jgi:hypothetical protein